MHDLGATIVAVASPPGRGGVGCVRISGPASEQVGLRLFSAATARAPQPGGRPAFGRFLDRDGTPVDHGYLVLFPAEASFTGEPAAELWPHGSPAVLSALVEAAACAGAVPAGPGEFTYRALRNGRLDLARAEAVRDLVEARTTYQARVAFAQAEGALSRRLAPLREQMEEWIARAEAAVEFSDEADTHLGRGQLRRAITDLRSQLEDLLGGFQAARVVREGATVVITGPPNAGKSSIFNRLLARERAIVHEAAGTTRDTLEEVLDLDGIPLRLVDTAGLRAASDPVESEGVRRAERARTEADLVLRVIDGSMPLAAGEHDDLQRASGGATLVVVNKGDLSQVAVLPHDIEFLRLSARTGDGFDRLRAQLRRRLLGTAPLEQPIMTNSRHAWSIEAAATALVRAERAADAGIPEEMLLEDLRDAMRHLAEITGEFGTEQLYDRIFSTFCIGK